MISHAFKLWHYTFVSQKIHCTEQPVSISKEWDEHSTEVAACQWAVHFHVISTLWWLCLATYDIASAVSSSSRGWRWGALWWRRPGILSSISRSGGRTAGWVFRHLSIACGDNPPGHCWCELRSCRPTICWEGSGRCRSSCFWYSQQAIEVLGTVAADRSVRWMCRGSPRRVDRAGPEASWRIRVYPHPSWRLPLCHPSVGGTLPATNGSHILGRKLQGRPCQRCATWHIRSPSPVDSL